MGGLKVEGPLYLFYLAHLAHELLQIHLDDPHFHHVYCDSNVYVLIIIGKNVNKLSIQFWTRNSHVYGNSTSYDHLANKGKYLTYST